MRVLYLDKNRRHIANFQSRVFHIAQCDSPLPTSKIFQIHFYFFTDSLFLALNNKELIFLFYVDNKICLTFNHDHMRLLVKKEGRTIHDVFVHMEKEKSIEIMKSLSGRFVPLYFKWKVLLVDRINDGDFLNQFFDVNLVNQDPELVMRYQIDLLLKEEGTIKKKLEDAKQKLDGFIVEKEKNMK